MFIHIVSPQERKINYKLFQTEHKPIVVTAKGKTTYTWHLQNLPGTPVDDDIPGWLDPYPGVYISEFNSWKEVINWALPLYEPADKLSKPLIVQIDSIKSTYGSNEDRVKAALRFVQDEVRYLGMESGIGGYKPRSPSTVYAQRFGDCKDKSLLLCSMLRHMGIEAYPALVNSTYKGQVAELLPSPYAFNHCIVQVDFWGKKLWFDPTISKQRGAYDNIFVPAYEQALVINPASKGLVAMTSSASRNAKIKVLETFIFDNIGGPVKLEVKTEYYGSDADYQRSNFATTSLKDIEKSYLNFYASNYPDIETVRSVEFLDFEKENKFTTLEEYVIKNLWQEQSHDTKLLEAGFYPQVLRNYLKQPRTSKRTMAMSLSYPVDIEHEILLFLPEYWPIKSEAKEILDDAFIYTSNISFDIKSNLATLKYTYTTLKDHVLPESMAAFRKNQKLVVEDMGQSLTYNKDLAGKDTAVVNFSWWVLGLSVMLALVALFGAYRLYFYDPVPTEVNYQSEDRISGWLILPLIGLIVTPFRAFITVISNNYFDQTIWGNLLSSSSSTFAPALAGLMGLELIINIVFVVYSLLLIKLFLDRRSSVPQLMVILYVSNLLLLVGEYIALETLQLPFETEENSPSQIISAFIAAAIWVPYFYKSERVKETFVVQLFPPDTKNKVQVEVAALTGNSNI